MSELAASTPGKELCMMIRRTTDNERAPVMSPSRAEHDAGVFGARPTAESLSALLPLKVSGRHYGENLERVDLLLSSLVHFAQPDLYEELLIVVRSDEAELIAEHLAHWGDLPVRIVLEDEHFPAFRRFTRPWQLRPWQRQQIIKLNAPALTTADYVLVLDPDVIAVKPVTHELLFPGGRALLEPQPRSVHTRWWLDSAGLLDVDPGLDRPGMNVTPAILSVAILREVQQRLEAVGGRPWMDILLTSYCDWTEYTLYVLAGERAGLLDAEHVWADDREVAAYLHLTASIWDAGAATSAAIEQLFTVDDPGLFAVLQSNTGLAAAEVAEVVAHHLPVRRVPKANVPVSHRTSKLKERVYTVLRLLASAIYRLRRRLA